MQKIIKYILIFTVIAINLHFICGDVVKCYAAGKGEPFESMIAMETSTGRIFCSKDAEKRLPIASTTKILTAIVAIERGGDLDIKYEMPKEAVGIEGSSIYLKAGEHLTLRELLYGLMLRSGNDAAVAIAMIVSGSVENFVELMNEYCKKLNLKNSNFVTVNGLHNENHYSCAYDLAKITAYALSNETFLEIVSTKEKVIENENDAKNKCRLLKNKNKLLNIFEGANGVKTGYTTKAGKCFVGSALRNGMQVVCVVLNSKSMFNECLSILNKVFDEYNMKNLLKKGELENVKLPIKKRQNFPILLKKDIKYPLNEEEMQKIYAQIVIRKDLKVPISENDEIGQIEIYIGKDLIFSDKIYTINIEDEWNIVDFIGKVIQIF